MNQGCGGTLVGDKYVVTAAHCTDGASPSSLYVQLGDTSLDTDFESVAFTVPVAAIKQHPDYDSSTTANDISVLELQTAISLTEYPNIKPACLPSQDAEFTGDAIVSGWGTVGSGMHLNSWLHEVNVTVFADGNCGSMNSHMTPDMMCAGLMEGGKDACQGDSGGPLVASDPAMQGCMSLVGVVSWGFGCAGEDALGIYAKVSHFTNWLHEQMPDLNTCPPKYSSGSSTPTPSPSSSSSSSGCTDWFHYLRVFGHDTAGGLFDSHDDALNKNADNHGADLFSILDQLENYRNSDGNFHLKLCYPEVEGLGGSHCNEWVQSSNPVEETTITGFRAISLAFNNRSDYGPWVGLGRSPADLTDTLMDDKPDSGWSYSAIGATRYRGRGYIPGPRPHKVHKVELFVNRGNKNLPLHPTLFIITKYSECTSPPTTTSPSPSASSSPSSGSCGNCVFPFIFANRQHDTCTTAEHDAPWCATEVDTSGQMISWEDCQDSCPGTSETTTQQMTVAAGNEEGSCCKYS